LRWEHGWPTTTVGTALLRTGPDGRLTLTAYGERFARVALGIPSAVRVRSVTRMGIGGSAGRHPGGSFSGTTGGAGWLSRRVVVLLGM